KMGSLSLSNSEAHRATSIRLITDSSSNSSLLNGMNEWNPFERLSIEDECPLDPLFKGKLVMQDNDSEEDDRARSKWQSLFMARNPQYRFYFIRQPHAPPLVL